jgi:hypothetical protein
MTYLESIAGTLTALGCDPSDSASFFALIQDVSADWNVRPMTAGPGFKTGVTSSGIPIEFSVALSRSHPPRFRFVTDPGLTELDLNCRVKAIFDKCVLLPKRFLDCPLPDVVLEVFDLLRANFRGRSTILPMWIGGEFDGVSLTGIKYYFDTGLFSKPGEAFGASLVSITKLGQPFWEAMTRKQQIGFTRCCGFGINVFRNGCEFKLYYRCFKTSDALLSWASEFPSVDQSIQSNLDFARGRSGKMFFTCRYQADSRQLEIDQMHFFTEHFFDNDEAVFSWCDEAIGCHGENRALIQRLRTATADGSGSNRRITTCLGLNNNKINLYFIPLKSAD